MSRPADKKLFCAWMKEVKNVIKMSLLAVNFSFFLNQKIYIPMNDDIDSKKKLRKTRLLTNDRGGALLQKRNAIQSASVLDKEKRVVVNS